MGSLLAIVALVLASALIGALVSVPCKLVLVLVLALASMLSEAS